MSRYTLQRPVRRLAVASATAAVAVLATAVPAAAHVEVESEKAQALAKDVTLDFEAESESDSAGITELRVVLPEGIEPSDVEYGDGPKGWKFKGADDGFTVKGPAVKVGENAKYSITVSQLPDAEQVPFKTLQTYSDGRTDRWIELDEKGQQPAPILKLEAAEPGAKPDKPSPSASGSSKAPESDSSSKRTADAVKTSDDGLPTAAWMGIGAVVLAVLAVLGYVIRRRSGTEQ
jgi:uncharacterized protein YcnI